MYIVPSCLSLDLKQLFFWRILVGMPRGKWLKSQMKEVLLSIYRFLEKMECKTKRKNTTCKNALNF